MRSATEIIPATPHPLCQAAGVILLCSPSATSPWCDPFWTRHCRCMNLHLFNPDLADPALLLVNCAAGVILPCQDLYESPSTASILHESPPLSDVYQLTLPLPFVRKAPVPIRSWTARIYMNLPLPLDTGATPP
jgi:hypothetical protein